MDYIVHNYTNLNIHQLHSLMGEYLRQIYPNDNGATVYPEWVNREGIKVQHVRDMEFIVRTDFEGIWRE